MVLRLVRRVLRRGFEAEPFTWAVVQFAGDVLEIVRREDRQVGSLGEVLTQEPVGVFAAAALPG